MSDRGKALAEAGEALIKRVVHTGLDGAGPFKGAVQIADEALKHAGGDVEAAVTRCIKVHVRLAGVEGFATGIPGVVALPVTIPTDVGAFYILAGRMVGAIAHLRGYDVKSDDVRSAVLVALLGAGGAEVLHEFGITVGGKGLAAALKKVPGKLFIEINKRVGFRLITKAGEKGVINVSKLVPLIGGPIGGGVNIVGMKAIGKYAKTQFPVRPVGEPNPDVPSSVGS